MCYSMGLLSENKIFLKTIFIILFHTADTFYANLVSAPAGAFICGLGTRFQSNLLDLLKTWNWF